GQGGGQERARTPGGGGYVLQLQGVQGGFQGAQQFPAAGVAGVEFAHEVAGDLQVQGQVPHLVFEDGQVGAGEPVERFVLGTAPGTPVGGVEGRVAEDDGVGCGLHIQSDVFAAVGPAGQGDPGVAGVEPLDDGAVGTSDEPFGLEAGVGRGEAEVDQGLDGVPGPAVGHAPAQAEPGRAPGRAP